MDWFIPALLGFAGGVIGSLVAPWVHWTIEKRRTKIEYRRSLVNEWRQQIESFNWSKDNFGNSSTYAAMRPHMKPEMIRKFEDQRTVYVPPDGGRGDNLTKQWASDEVARLEVEWELL